MCKLALNLNSATETLVAPPSPKLLLANSGWRSTQSLRGAAGVSQRWEARVYLIALLSLFDSARDFIVWLAGL